MSEQATRKAAGLAGVLFLTLGIVGFVPEVTTGYTAFNTWSNAHAHLFGVFQISVMHLAFFVLFGLAGLRLAPSVAGSRVYLTSGGFLFLATAAYGFGFEFSGEANFLSLDRADNWADLGLGAAMLALGLVSVGAVRRPATA